MTYKIFTVQPDFFVQLLAKIEICAVEVQILNILRLLTFRTVDCCECE